MSKTKLFIFSFFLMSQIFGQNKKVTLYYASELKDSKIKNIYYVLADNQQVLNGPFWQFYENKKLAIKGNYQMGTPKGLWRYFFESGALKLEGKLENKNEGYWTYYYESGQKTKEGQLNGQREEGSWVYYYENGSIRKEGKYLKGSKEGKWFYFFEDSVRKAEAIFENGEGIYKEYYYQGDLKMEGPIINGHSEGIWTYYYKTGQVRAQGLEIEGKKNGHWTYFFKSGVKSSEGTYHSSKQEGEWTYYYENGKIRTLGIVTDGNRENKWITYKDDGSSKAQVSYNNNLGIYNERYPSGKVKVTGALKGGNRNGKWTYFYESGGVEGECFFEDGKGDYTGYYPNGDRKAEGILEGNIKIGLWKLYDQDGKVVYLRTVYNEKATEMPEISLTEQVIDSVIVEDLKQAKNESKPSSKVFKYKQTSKWRKNIRWMKPKPNESKGLIVGTNPFSVIANSLPVSVEYFIQERQGYQFRYHLIRQPFFLNEESIPIESVYKRGGAVDVIAKIYSRDNAHGMLYWGPSFRVSAINHFVKVQDSISGTSEVNTKTLNAQEQTYEFAMLFGNRMMRTFKQNSITFDLYAGVGIGFRNFRKNYDTSNEYYDVLYNNTSQSKLFLPIRLGFSIGYFFK